MTRWERIQLEVAERQEQYMDAKRNAFIAKIFRMCFFIPAFILLCGMDSKDWIFVLILDLLFWSLTFTAHIFVLAFEEEADELRGVEAWER